MEGPLSKWTNLVNGWQYRWFVLDRSAGLLSYYTSKEKMIRGDRRGCVKLKLAQVGIDDEDDSTFTITTYDNKNFHFQARDADERHKWLEALQETRDLHSTVASGPSGASGHYRRVVVGRNSTMAGSHGPPALHAPLAQHQAHRMSPYAIAAINASFDQSLSEADAYLVLLLEQQKAFETRCKVLRSEMDDCARREVVASAGNGAVEIRNTFRSRRNDCEALLSRLQSICSLIKQTVMSLQMSRHTLYSPLSHPPVLNSRQQPQPSSGEVASALSRPGLGPTGHHAVLESAPPGLDARSSGGRHRAAPGALNSPSSANPAAAPTSGAGMEPIRPFLAPGDAPSGDVEVGASNTDAKLPSVVPSVVPNASSVEIGQDASVLLGPTIIPEMSYSSSEDEEFFDTEEFLNSPKHTHGSSEAQDSDNHTTVEENITDNTGKLSVDGSEQENGQEIYSETPYLEDDDSTYPCTDISTEQDTTYYDDLYDGQVEEELGSVKETHGSVISHLVSQVRIGMDLTKIVLPTFILEKRSTLEMYADFLAHADLWAMIGEGRTPEERMIRCLRWYLSAFHAGRRSSVAKKPYNPILGEIFQCYWPLRDKTSSSGASNPLSKENTRTDGPCQWAPDNAVTFIAEQVSHHPPISAFYAEHTKQRISLDGYIWTRSKFLGLSIAVHMVGQAVISLLDYGEEYTVNFPSGYGRSIFTVPWIELGGNCSIQCSKTGWESKIQFKTKPFYGGGKDLVKAEVFSPNDRRRPTMIVEGQWNDRMDAKWMNSQGNIVRQELFIDTKKIPVMKKCVLPRTEQKEHESRRLWQEVTYNLKNHNIEAATAAKAYLEQKQRDEARDRRDRSVKWETRHFQEVGEHWVYNDPLCKRTTSTVSLTLASANS